MSDHSIGYGSSDLLDRKSVESADLLSMYRVSNSTGHLVDDQNGTQLSTAAKGRLIKRFSIQKSTEEHHKETDDTGYYGAYGSLRKKLDYSYHVHYRKERQWLHDAIIEDCLLEHQHDDWSEQDMTTVLPKNPWLIIIAGVHGAGKHHVIRELIDSKRLPLLSFVCVDTDDLRRYLPEYSTYCGECPDKADILTRKEAGYIAETLNLASLQSGRNVIFHCNIKDSHWYKDSYIPFIRQQFHELRVALIHVTANPKEVLTRARERAFNTGRVLVEKKLLESLNKHVPCSCELLKPLVDSFYTIQNNGEKLELIEGGDWKKFTDTFDQRHSIMSLSYPQLSRNYVSHRRNCAMRRSFSAVQSSEANHMADDAEYYGQFADIRKTLDYSYHRNYTFERQKFQDAIIREFLDSAVVHDRNGEVCTTPTHPWAVFTAGAMGAGKGYTIKKLVEKGRFPLLAFVRVNPDAIRRYMPEYHLYIETNPELAGELTNKEAGFIAEILTLAGLQRGKNVMVDGSLRHADWYRTFFERLRKEFQDIRLAIIHVVAPREAIFRRAAKRALHTGRIVPRELLVATIEQVPRSVRELRPLVDYHVELMNDSKAPDIQIVTPNENWESFTSHWVQTCRWVPKARAKMIEKSRMIEVEMEQNMKA